MSAHSVFSGPLRWNMAPKYSHSGFNWNSQQLVQAATDCLDNVRNITLLGILCKKHTGKGEDHQVRVFPAVYESGGRNDENQTTGYCQIVASEDGGRIPSNMVYQLTHAQERPNGRHATIEIGKGQYIAFGAKRNSDIGVLIYQVVKTGKQDPTVITKALAKLPKSSELSLDERDWPEVPFMQCELVGWHIDNWEFQDDPRIPDHLKGLYDLVLQKLRSPSWHTINCETMWTVPTLSRYDIQFNGKLYLGGDEGVNFVTTKVTPDKLMSTMFSTVDDYRRELNELYLERKARITQNGDLTKDERKKEMDGLGKNPAHNLVPIHIQFSIDEGVLTGRFAVIRSLLPKTTAPKPSDDGGVEVSEITDPGSLPFIIETVFSENFPADMLLEPSLTLKSKTVKDLIFNAVKKINAANRGNADVLQTTDDFNLQMYAFCNR